MEENSDAGAAGAAGNLRDEAAKALCAVRGRGLAGFFSFDHMYFPIVARYLFIAICLLLAIGMVLGTLGGLAAMVSVGFVEGAAAVFTSLAGGVMGLLTLRLIFETILLGFSINSNIEALRDKF